MGKKILKIFALVLLSLIFLSSLFFGGYVVYVGHTFLDTFINIFYFIYFLFSDLIIGIALFQNKKTSIFLLGFLPVFVFGIFVVGEYLWNLTIIGAIITLYIGLQGQILLLKKKLCCMFFLLFIPLFIYIIPPYLCEKENYEVADVYFKWNWKTGMCEEKSTMPIPEFSLREDK